MLKYVWQVSFVQSVSEHGAGTGVGKLRKDEQSTFSLSSFFLEHEKIIRIKKQIEKIFFILWSIMRE